MIREVIKIDETVCDGCGICVPACAEGELQIIDGKARLISDLFCDGLGACIAECPQGAITIEQREAEPYNEYVVMQTIVKGGQNIIQAHLKHLKDHKEFELFAQAVDYLNDNKIPIPVFEEVAEEISNTRNCPGSREKTSNTAKEFEVGQRQSHLTHWPIQMHLINPLAAHFKNSDLLLAADCCAFSYGDFHKDFLINKTLAIACPKLDSNKNIYLDKLITMINDSNLKSITVLIMQVPCCGGLLQLAQQAVENSRNRIPLKVIVMGTEGYILQVVEFNK
jgi:ferredoxin